MKCQALASHKYTWPGGDQAYICREHAQRLRTVAEAMGLHLQILPVESSDVPHECDQAAEVRP